MGQMLSYSLASGTILMAIYVIYKWLLSGENQHEYNRMTILCGYAVAFLYIPVRYIFSCVTSVNTPPPTLTTDIDVVLQSIIAVEEAEYIPLVYPLVIITIYTIGMIVVAIHTLMVWGRIYRLISTGEKINCNHYKLILVSDDTIAPFSWFRYIVMSRDDYALAGQMIKIHEIRHLQCMHWIDLLIAQVLIIINWFNPAAWLMREELKAIHEYQADMQVLKSGINAREYQLLLIKKAVGARFPSLANSLNHSKLKKRITMMLSSKTSKRRRWCALAIVPAVAAALSVINLPVIASVMDDVKSADLNRLLYDADKVSYFPEENQEMTFYEEIARTEESMSDILDEMPLKTTDEKSGASSTHVDEAYPITGMVVDIDGNPVIGAIVKEVGKTKGTATDINGKFQFDSSNGKTKIEVMYVGYSSVILPCTTGHPIKAILHPETAETESTSEKNEIKVVGTSTSTSTSNNVKNIIEINTSITADILKMSEIFYGDKRITVDEFNALPKDKQKLAYAVKDVEKNTNRVFVPDENKNSLIYIVDGNPVNPDKLNTISPESIESITVNRQGNAILIETKQTSSDGSTTTTTTTTTTYGN